MKQKNEILGKMKNTFCAEFYFTGESTPYVKVTVIDDDAQEHEGLFLVDTCSCQNKIPMNKAYLFSLHAEGENCSLLEKGELPKENARVKTTFTLGGCLFKEEFKVSKPISYSSSLQKPVLGILGLEFLVKYGLTLDYGQFMLYKPLMTLKGKLRLNDFCYPIEKCLQCYKAPMLFLCKNGDDILAVVNTGRKENVILRKVLKRNGWNAMCGYTALDIDLLGVATNPHAQDRYSCETEFVITEKDGLYKENVNRTKLYPVEAQIGSDFLFENELVLDFEAKMIYKPKRLEL